MKESSSETDCIYWMTVNFDVKMLGLDTHKDSETCRQVDSGVQRDLKIVVGMCRYIECTGENSQAIVTVINRI